MKAIIRRAGAASIALWVLALALQPLIALALAEAPVEPVSATAKCTDHSCCRKGQHKPVQPDTPRLVKSCCPGAGCAFGQLLVLKLGHLVPVATQSVMAMVAEPVPQAEIHAVVLPARDSALYQRPPPAL